MILLTGHSGYLGSYLRNSYNSNKLFKLGRSSDSNIICDLSREVPNISSIENINCVIHAAGKAHSIPRNELQRNEFFIVNERGTANLLAGLESSGSIPKQFVFISTVAVYGEMTPYAESKLNAENLVLGWCKKVGCNALILRLPLIFGFGAPGNLGAMERAIKKGYYFGVGSGLAKRSVVFIEDIIDLIEGLTGDESGIHNIVSKDMSYLEVESIFAERYNKKIRRVPSSLVRRLAKIGDQIPFFPINSYRLEKLETSLTFEGSSLLKPKIRKC